MLQNQCNHIIDRLTIYKLKHSFNFGLRVQISIIPQQSTDKICDLRLGRGQGELLLAVDGPDPGTEKTRRCLLGSYAGGAPAAPGEEDTMVAAAGSRSMMWNATSEVPGWRIQAALSRSSWEPKDRAWYRI